MFNVPALPLSRSPALPLSITPSLHHSITPSLHLPRISLAIAALFFTRVSFANDDAYWLIPEDQHAVIVHLVDQTQHPIATVAAPLIYGRSADEIGIITVDPEHPGTSVLLTIIDERTAAHTVYPSLNVRAVTGMLGPIDQLVVTADTACFITDGPSPGFTLAIYSRKERQLHTSKMPADIRNPLLASFGPNIFLYSSNGRGLWKVSEPARSITTIVPENSRRLEQSAAAAGPLWKEYLPVPRLGLFRITRSGTLQQITDENGKWSNQHPARPITGEILKSLLIPDGPATAIGIVTKEESGHRNLRFLDPTNLEEKAKVPLPEGASLEGSRAAGDGSFHFFNAQDRTLQAISSTGVIRRIATLDRASSVERIKAARILSILSP